MNISAVYIACYKYDFHLTRICVASIRYWYPDIPVFLLKDHSKGDFNTSEIENYWNVQVFDTGKKKFGWGFIKFEPWFQEKQQKLLIIDSDIVFLGKVLDKLAKIPEQFIVSADFADVKTNMIVENNYYNLNKLISFDASFDYPGYVFNSGHVVVSSGIISREEVYSYLTQNSVLEIRQKDIFKNEQGLANYILNKLAQQRKISISPTKFNFWIGNQEAKEFDLKTIKIRKGVDRVLHWAGVQRPIAKMPRRDILKFYERLYYEKIPGASRKRRLRNILDHLRIPFRDYSDLLNRGLKKMIRKLKKYD